MIHMPHKHHNARSATYADICDYTITFGIPTAPYIIDIFYGVECGFSKEFFQCDFKDILDTFAHTEKAFIRLYPAALDSMTTRFAELIRLAHPDIKRHIFMQCCHNNSMYETFLLEAPSENVYFDITKILADHPDITETLMIKINGVLLNDIPSFYALSHAMK